MFIHLFDDEKFVDGAIQLYEESKIGIHQYIIIIPNENYTLTFVKSNKAESFDQNNLKLNQILLGLKSTDVLVVHYLSDTKIKLLLPLKLSCKMVWMIWGGDAYPLVNEKILLRNYFSQHSLIYSLFQNNNIKIALFSSKLNYYKWKIQRDNKKKKVGKLISRFHFFSSVVPNEEQLFRKYLPLKKAKYIPFNYVNINSLTQSLKDISISNDSVLLGNSGDPSNNHLEIIEWLKNNESNKTVYAPLSYGYQKYIDYIENEGKKHLGINFIALRQYMKIEDYNVILSKCKYAMMNHYRQQAVGNILSMLWLGSMVFLREESCVYQFLKENKVKVYSLNELLHNKLPLDFFNITEEEIKQNRSFLTHYFSSSSVMERTKNFIAVLEK